MKIIGNARIQKKVSKKGNDYNILSLRVGNGFSIRYDFFVSEELIPDMFEQGEVEVELSIEPGNFYKPELVITNIKVI